MHQATFANSKKELDFLGLPLALAKRRLGRDGSSNRGVRHRLGVEDLGRYNRMLWMAG